MAFEGIRQIDREVIGEPPDQETYETYSISSKEMELTFYENSNTFWIFVKKTDKKKIPGETTALFKEMLKKIQEKANELQKPMKLILDPVVQKTEDWAKTRAAAIVGGWDAIKPAGSYHNYEKTFYPQTNKHE